MDIEESKILLKDFQKGKIEKDKLEHYRGSYKMGYFYTADIQEAIETVLSELEKKDSLINEQLKENVRLQNELNEENKRCMILANNDKFKEQVIDEMAIYINNFDIDEDICKKVDEPCKNYAGENGKLCNECIIDYFTKKVEGK